MVRRVICDIGNRRLWFIVTRCTGQFDCWSDEQFTGIAPSISAAVIAALRGFIIFGGVKRVLPPLLSWLYLYGTCLYHRGDCYYHHAHRSITWCAIVNFPLCVWYGFDVWCCVGSCHPMGWNVRLLKWSRSRYRSSPIGSRWCVTPSQTRLSTNVFSVCRYAICLFGDRFHANHYWYVQCTRPCQQRSLLVSKRRFPQVQVTFKLRWKTSCQVSAPVFVAIALFFFAFTTIMAYYYIAETNIRYLTRTVKLNWAIPVLKVVILFVVIYSCLKPPTWHGHWVTWALVWWHG